MLSICSAAGQPVVVQGGMTGLAGGATPRAGQIAISLERMSGIEEIDRHSMTATVWAGTPLASVQQRAAEEGFLFPLDLGARGSCTIGDMEPFLGHVDACCAETSCTFRETARRST